MIITIIGSGVHAAAPRSSPLVENKKHVTLRSTRNKTSVDGKATEESTTKKARGDGLPGGQDVSSS